MRDKKVRGVFSGQNFMPKATGYGATWADLNWKPYDNATVFEVKLELGVVSLCANSPLRIREGSVAKVRI